MNSGPLFSRRVPLSDPRSRSATVCSPAQTDPLTPPHPRAPTAVGRRSPLPPPSPRRTSFQGQSRAPPARPRTASAAHQCEGDDACRPVDKHIADRRAAAERVVSSCIESTVRRSRGCSLQYTLNSELTWSDRPQPLPPDKGKPRSPSERGGRPCG